MHCGVVRGHSYNCPHDVERGPCIPSNPLDPNLCHAITVALTWDQVLEYIVEPHALLPAPRRPPPMRRSKLFHRDFLRDLRDKTRRFGGTDVVYTMQCMWTYCRSGVFVSVRNGRMELFVPFCNAQYRNFWPPEARAKFLSPSATGLPFENWWMNGWMICDQVPSGVCGDHWLTTLRHMVRTCCTNDGDFILNKRDCPLIRRDLGDPMNPFGEAQPLIDPRRMLRVFSFYGGPLHLDVPCPIAADWQRLQRTSFSQAHPRPVEPPFVDMYFESKESKAVFRGSLTGTGQRAAWCRRRYKHADVACTSMNVDRRRIDPCTLTEVPVDVRGVRRAPRMCMNEQQQSYKYAIYLNGHSGPDRAARLFNGSQVVLKPESCAHDLGQDLWFTGLLHPMQHYVKVAMDGSDVDEVIEKLEASSDVAEAITSACGALPLTVEGIKEWWYFALL